MKEEKKKGMKRRKFLQVVVGGITSIGFTPKILSVGEVSSEDEIRGIKVELTDGSIVGVEIPDKIISKKNLLKILKKAVGKKINFPQKIGNIKFTEFKNRDFFDIYYRPSEIFLTEYFSPYVGTSDALEAGIVFAQEFVLIVEIFLIYVVVVVAFAVILAIIVFPMAVLEPSTLLSERNKLIQQALWKIGEFPIFVESPAGVVSVKLVDIPGDFHLEVPSKNKVISIPLVETEFGTIVRNIKDTGKRNWRRFFQFFK